ncbi:MAG: hypothetical protein ACOH1K_07215 [Rhodoglobus sp.]
MNSNKKTIWIAGAAAAVALVLGGTIVAVADPFENNNDNDRTSNASYDSNGSNDSSDGNGSNSNDNNDSNGSDSRSDDARLAPLTDAERTSASDAALAEIGEGTVTDVERSDDPDHAFEVDIDLADGSDVTVELDGSFAVTRVDW